MLATCAHAPHRVAGRAPRHYFTNHDPGRRDMALLPRFASNRRSNEAALEQQVTALQAALNQCKGMARHWRDTRYEVIAITAVVALALGFAAGVYRETLFEPVVAVAQSVGLAAEPQNVETADAAYQKGDYRTALRIAQPLAEAGNARAQTLMAQLYYRGRGVNQDDHQAAKWFRAAAKQGDASAQFYLGVMSTEGRGVPQDYTQATKWYRMAAEQGDAQAQYNLGLAYARGEGITQSNVDAHMWFNLAAARFPASDTRNRAAAVKNRDTVAGEMTSEQLAQAQKMAHDWRPKKGTSFSLQGD
jgi:hypothetical protein